MLERMNVFQFTSWDGTRLAGFEAGDPSGPPLVLVNGLGGNITSWKHVVRGFAGHYRVLSYDYRGLYRSAPALKWDSYTVADHARDLEYLLETHAPQGAIVCGWSMGVQVILELHRRRPDLVRAFVALNGTPGKPFETAFHTDLLQARFERTFRMCRAHWQRVARLRPLLARQAVIQTFVRSLQVAGIASWTLDKKVFSELALEWVEMDLGVYAWIFEQLGHHDASDILPHVTAPTLVIAGQADRFTPAHRSELMAEIIPDSELYVIPKATHFCPVEFPDRVNRRMWRFFVERGLLTGDAVEEREVA